MMKKTKWEDITMKTVEQIIERLGLVPLEGEGGMFVSTYNHEEKLESGAPLGGAIYYLLHGKAFSHFHVLTGDEIWLFHGGDPVELVTLWPDGSWKVTRLGMDLAAGEVPQALVPKGVWMGACLEEGGDYALMSTVTVPGYTEGAYTHGNKKELCAKWPEAEAWIERLTGEAIFF